MLLTEAQAFQAMYLFLSNYWESTKSDEIGALLGGLSLLSDGTAADPAYSNEWKKSVQKVLSGPTDINLHLR